MVSPAAVHAQAGSTAPRPALPAKRTGTHPAAAAAAPTAAERAADLERRRQRFFGQVYESESNAPPPGIVPLTVFPIGPNGLPTVATPERFRKR